MWDGDIMPEGISSSWSGKPLDHWKTNLDFGFLLIDEKAGASDPSMFAVQLDNEVSLSDIITLKGSSSYYGLRKLDSLFFARGVGNTAGLAGGSHINLFEFYGAVIFDGIENWPVTVWGNVIRNASAKPVPGQGKQDLGWGVGVEAGDKKKYVRLGASYFEFEADAVPTQLGDSDVFDGVGNGEGWVFHGTRNIWKNTDLAITIFLGDVLDKGVVPYQAVTVRDRVRAQWELKVKF
jgi:hypothetical protein